MAAAQQALVARVSLALLIAAAVVLASNEGSSFNPQPVRRLSAGAAAQKPSPAELAKAQAEWAAQQRDNYLLGIKAKNETREANVTAVKAKKPPPKKHKVPVKVLPGGNPRKAEEEKKLKAKVQNLYKKWSKKEKPALKPHPGAKPPKVALKISTHKRGTPWSLAMPGKESKPNRKHIGGGTPATISCPGMPCLSDLDHLFSDSLAIPAKFPGGAQGDLAKVFDLKGVAQQFMTTMGKTFCSLIVKGSAIKDQTFGWENMPTDIQRYLKPLFDAMPLVDDQYYFVAAAFTAYPPNKNLNAAADVLAGYDASVAYIKKGMALAINPCKHDYVFQFVGAEAPPINVANLVDIVLSMNSFGWSEGRTLLSSNTVGGEPAIDPSFWVPGADGGRRDLVVNGKFYYQGTISVKPHGSNNFASIALEGTARFFLDIDPLNDGSGGKDFAFALGMSAAPKVTLGLVEIPLDKMVGSASTRLYMAYGTSFTMAISVQILDGKGLAPLLEPFTIIPSSVRDAVGSIFGALIALKSIDVYGGPDTWGLRLTINGKGGSLRPIGGLLELLNKIDPRIPTDVNPQFSISGPTSGNGLPVAVTVGLTNVGDFTLYFCGSSSDCPGGHSCTLGVCVKVSCPAGSYSNGPLSCWRNSCPSGYYEVLGVCWERCPANTVDIGVDCKYCPDSAVSEYDAGFCYTPCRSGYNGAATMCVGTSCQAEYTNMGLTCFRPYASYGKGCSHWYMKCNPVWCNPVYCNPVRCWWDWGPRCSGGDCHGGDCHGGECWWEYTDGGGCAGGYYDAGCFCARDAHSYGNTYDRGVGKLPSTYSKKTVAMAVLPILTLPPKPSGQNSLPEQFANVPSSASGQPATASYAFVGCYTDNGGRMVPTLLDSSYGASVTVENCASIAKTKGYSLFALQDGGTCWGGNDVTKAKSLGVSSSCTKGCTGNGAATCGGPWANQLYTYNPSGPPVLLSQGKPASLSSRFGGEYPASFANDGVLTNFAHTSCNLDGAGPWWSVDLGGLATVSSISITNRVDCCQGRLSGYTLRVGNLPPSDPSHFTQSAICYTTTGSQSPPTQSYSCSPALSGRYVSLRIDGRAECLNIAEVQVFGW